MYDLTLGQRKERVESPSRSIRFANLGPRYCSNNSEDSGSTHEPQQFSTKCTRACQWYLPSDAAGETTWYHFASAILDEAAQISPEVSWFADATQGRPLITKRITPITTAEYPTPAARPRYSVLSNSRLVQRFGIRLPDWREQLHRVFRSECRAQAHGDPL